MIKKFLLLLIAKIFLMSNASCHPKYKVLSVKELTKIETNKKQEIDSSYIIDYNGAFVTTFKDKSSIILPPVLGGEEGLLFYDIADMYKMIENKVYPVKGNNSFWEKESLRVLKFPDAINYYCSELSRILNYGVEINNDTAYLGELSRVINTSLGSKKQKSLLYNYLAIYISELLRRKADATWQLMPQKALNVYYIPEIVKDGKFCTPWSFLIGQLEMVSFMPINIENLLDRANLFYPIQNRTYKSHSFD